MKTKKMLNDYSNIYQVTRTIQLGLEPVGKTLENMQKNGIIDNDISKNKACKEVKILINEWHKRFINEKLCNIMLEGLEKAFPLYIIKKKNDQEKKEFAEFLKKTREHITNEFKKDPAFEKMDKKGLFTEELPALFSDDEEKLSLLKQFDKDTTYFTDFNRAKKNMYSDKAKTGSVANRIIQNIYRYFDNIIVFNKIKDTDITDSFHELELKLNEAYPGIGKITDYFIPENFNKTITQNGIDMYNSIIGGYSEESGNKVQGLNELINLYCQKNKVRLPKFKFLFKQILSDKDSISFILKQFSSDSEVLDAIKDTCIQLSDLIKEKIPELFADWEYYDLSKIYISKDDTVNFLSMTRYGDRETVKNKIMQDYDARNPIGKKSLKSHEDKKLRTFEKTKYYSMSYLNNLIEKDIEGNDIKKILSNKVFASLEKIRSAYPDFDKLYEKKYNSGKRLKGNINDISVIKDLLDGLKELQKVIKLFTEGSDLKDKDENFYEEIEYIWNSLEQVTKLYNMARNYLTGKPYSKETIQLKYANAEFGLGWDKSKEKDYGVVLFKKGIHKYIGVIDKKNRNCLENIPLPITDDTYLKMEYKQITSPVKMLPKVFFSKKWAEKHPIPEEIFKIYKEKTYRTNVEDCHKLIDYYKESMKKYKKWDVFNFNFSDTDTYSDFDQFCEEISQQAYKVDFTEVDVAYINKLVDEGSLYLFKLYDKDFSSYSKGTPNLYTLYLNALFSKENLINEVYKLNGGAQIHYRKTSIPEENIIVHPAKQEIANKDPFNNKNTSIFDYDIIKDQRFTCDKFILKVPITMNYKAKEDMDISYLANCSVHDSEDMHIIGIDRGERNLLYISVIDLNGNIIEQRSLNLISSCNRDINYHDKLEAKAKENHDARQNWGKINEIRDYKKGYISQAIHVIIDLMIKYNAIIVMEDLNSEFKRSRQKIEYQVYQTFEKMLIDKLNYYVDKSKDPNEIGGLYKALQLTDKFKSFKTLGKQSGFIYYVPAWNTSNIDPTTGFVKMLNTKYESIEKSRKFIENIDNIRYEKEEGLFAFSINYDRFSSKAEGTKTDWIIYSYGNRITHFRNKKKNNSWDTEVIDLTKAFSDLFKEYNISIDKDDLRPDMLTVQSSDFYKRFMYLLNLTLQIRNSDKKNGIDQIISPVKNNKGEFYVSGINKSLPINADANGAYNIALKGLMLVRRIKDTDKEDMTDINLKISNKEWLNFVQNTVL